MRFASRPFSSTPTFASLAILASLAMTGCGAGTAPPVELPTVSPAPGVYHEPITITLADPAKGSTIYHSLSTNGQSGSVHTYTGPIQITQSTTVAAYASAPGQPNSQVLQANFVIDTPPDTPIISPASGSYAQTISVTIKDTTAGAPIFYTTDGSDPTSISAAYSGPIPVKASTTVKAIAYTADLGVASSIATAQYIITPPKHSWNCLMGCSAGGGSGPCAASGRGLIQSAAWTAANNLFWIFGGAQSTGTDALTHELWSFSPATLQWTEYDTGHSTALNAPGIYGTLGVAAAANVPGARKSALTWIDGGGNLWLFGGQGYDAAGNVGPLNDLWKFDTTSSLWTWEGGSTNVGAAGTYGTAGVAASSNAPGARYAGASWRDTAGNFWMLGATGYDSNGKLGTLNDLWTYSTTTGQWTWINGSSTVEPPASYGLLGITTPANTPGGYASTNVASVDAAGHLLLMGGTGLPDSSITGGLLNATWQYAPGSGGWTWISGSNKSGATGVYGTQGVAATTNIPGARDMGVGYTDSTGSMWVFGGKGVDSVGTTGLLNDLWQFDATTHQWTWQAGNSTANTPGVSGAQGIASTTNLPGARYGSVSWMDQSGNFYVYAGYGYDYKGNLDYLGDLWLFQP